MKRGATIQIGTPWIFDRLHLFIKNDGLVFEKDESFAIVVFEENFGL
jgi:hypothetical protein